MDDAKLELNTEANSDDDKLQRYIRTASRRVDGVMRNRVPLFAPVTETRRITVSPHDISSANGTLSLGTNFLLAATTVTSAGGSVLTASTEWDYYPTPGQTPYSTLRRVSCCGGWYDWCRSTCDPYYYISIAGVWGYHTDYANAWVQVGTLGAAISSTTQTELTLTDIDGVDAYYSIPRVSVGTLLKVQSGDNLTVYDVTRVNYNTNKVTARPGVLGTTAATYENGTVVYAWQVEEPIRRGVARQAAFMNARRGRFDVVTGDGMGGTNRYPQDLLPELMGILDEYQYDRTY